MTNRTSFLSVPGIFSVSVDATWKFYVGRHKHTTGLTNVGKIFNEPNPYSKMGFQGMFNKVFIETLVNFEILACQ